MRLFFLFFVSVAATDVFGIVAPAHDRRLHARRFDRHPQRAMFVRMSPALDLAKPVASINTAGVAFATNKIIGDGDRNQIIARSYDGELIWKFSAGHPLSVPPEVIGNAVYLALRSGEVIKLNVESGTETWRTKLNSYVSRPLAIASGIIVASTAAQYLYALEETSGKTMWLYDSESTRTMVLQGGAPPLIIDQSVFYGNATGNIAVLDLKSGQLQHSYSPVREATSGFHDVVGQLAVLHRNLLAFTTSNGLVGVIDLEVEGQELKWQKKLAVITTSACHGDVCYVGTTKGEIIALGMQDGSVHWHRVLGWTVSSITPYKTHLYVAGNTGFITKLHISSGSRVWQENLGNSISASPVIFRGMIFFATGMYNLYGYRL